MKKTMMFHLRGLPFPHRFLIKFPRSFQTPSQTYFFLPLIAQGHQIVTVLNFLSRYGHPTRFRRIQKISQNRPSVTKKHKKKKRAAHFCRPAPKVALGAHLGTILVDSGMDFARIKMYF